MANAARLPAFLLFSIALMAPQRGACTLRETQAESLFRSTLPDSMRSRPETRREARERLAEAHLLAPERGDIANALGRLYLDADMLHAAADIARHTLARDSLSAGAELLLGSTQRRRWLVEGEERYRDEAIQHLARGLKREPENVEAWVELLPLLVDARERAATYAAARVALQQFPDRSEILLLFASAAQRAGRPEEAWRAFIDAIPRLRGPLRGAFEDPSPVLPPFARASLDGLTPGSREAFVEQFWRDADPDLVTPYNEARLEFWARATQAWFLYRRPNEDGWDARGDLLVRFGEPAWSERNAIIRPELAGGGTWLVWVYPHYGMRVWMEATNPLAAYREPFSTWSHPAAPFADSIARHLEWAVVDGWSVFPALAPGTQPLEVRCVTAQFESDSGGRLLAVVEAPGTPGDALDAEWVVLDSLGTERLRASRDMAPSACRPTEARMADFAATLPPGRYRVGVAVEDAGHRRGVQRRDVRIGPHPAGLSLSDLVITCGSPSLQIGSGPDLRIIPDPTPRITGSDDLQTFFEIYRLEPDSTNRSTFEATFFVRPQVPWWRGKPSSVLFVRREPATVQVSREATTSGTLRRQFVTIPLRALPVGRYRLEVEVRDTRNGSVATRDASFERWSATATNEPASTRSR